MTMRVWLYARLSNDDDPAQNSLQNQQAICRAFAEKKGWTIVGSSADDNISGMNFSRRGLDKVKRIDETDWYRHEGFFPVIIGKQEWEQVQRLLKQQARPVNGNQTKHRYAGLLTCQECGNSFSPMIRCWNGSRRVEYVCRGYQRNGKDYCSSHRIHEEVLDKAVWDYTEKLREQYAAELKKVTQLQKQWALRKPVLDAHCLTLQKEILRLEQEIDELVMEKIQT